MTQQGLRQASARALSGTASTYDGDWMAAFDKASIAAGPFDERLLIWINQQLGSSFTEINGAMAAYAESQGAPSWSAMGGFSTGPAPYLGMVGWGGGPARGKSGNAFANSRTPMVATDAISTAYLALFHGYINRAAGGGETSVGSGYYEASFEYPAGNCNRVTWTSAISWQPSAMSAILADGCALSTTIPAGATFWVNLCQNHPGGALLAGENNAGVLAALSGAKLQSVASGTSQVMNPSGYSSNVSTYFVPILGVIGQTTKASVIIQGDSAGAGFNDFSAQGSGLDLATFMIGLGRGFADQTVAFCNLGVGGTTSSTWQGMAANTWALLKNYCSHVVFEGGSLDNAASSTAWLANLQNNFAAITPAGVKKIFCTLQPLSATTDNFTSLAGQTAPGGWAATAKPTNAALRAGQPWMDYLFDMGKIVSDAADDGIRAIAPWAMTITNATMASGSNVLQLVDNSQYTFSSNDYETDIYVLGAGASGANLATWVTSVTDGLHVVLNNPNGTGATWNGSVKVGGISRNNGPHPDRYLYQLVGSGFQSQVLPWIKTSVGV